MSGIESLIVKVIVVVLLGNTTPLSTLTDTQLGF
jgi:hypothetical protein